MKTDQILKTQRKADKKHHQEKRSVGRPKKLFKDKKLRSVWISNECRDFFKRLGKDNFSKGLEIAREILSSGRNDKDISKQNS